MHPIFHLSIATIAISLTISCAPKGQASGRIPISQTTSAEVKAGGPLTADLASASDEVATSLVRDINRLAEEDWGGYRVTLIYGDIVNKTAGRVSTVDFEYVRDRILSMLSKNRSFRDNVKFVRKRARIESLNREELTGDGDPLQEGGDPNKVVRPEAEYVYYLNGDMYGIYRGSTELYYMKYTIDNARDAEVVFSEDYEVKYDR
ncbi:MAG: hypothetical protein P8J86_07090 [Phycisphaerales bacterium]|jgi:hypothetical protein|nr:hypothetical protein [Phycisphaerales bacterium]